MTKQCTNCKQIKDINEFGPRRRKGILLGHKSDCRVCSQKTSENWAKNNRDKIKAKYNPEKARVKSLESLYGLTAEQYDKMLNRQSKRCAICDKEEVVKDHRTGRTKRLSVDHNHKTGKIRDLLCDKCNRLFGLLGEDLSLISNMLKYAEKHQT